ncbi:MAG: IS3 family transposase [bacterium]
MAVNRLNQVWLSDITYIRIRTGFVYLAAILDAYSRKVIGYAVSMSLDTALTLQALKMAISRRMPAPGVIHHSDQGVQYASSEYIDELKKYGFQISMARTGNPYENAMMESFFKTLKNEEVYLWEYETYEDVVARLPYFLFLNRCIIIKGSIQPLATAHRMTLRNWCSIRRIMGNPARPS